MITARNRRSPQKNWESNCNCEITTIYFVHSVRSFKVSCLPIFISLFFFHVRLNAYRSFALFVLSLNSMAIHHGFSMRFKWGKRALAFAMM